MIDHTIFTLIQNEAEGRATSSRSGWSKPEHWIPGCTPSIAHGCSSSYSAERERLGCCRKYQQKQGLLVHQSHPDDKRTRVVMISLVVDFGWGGAHDASR
jgi:hypothetical protein